MINLEQNSHHRNMKKVTLNQIGSPTDTSGNSIKLKVVNQVPKPAVVPADSDDEDVVESEDSSSNEGDGFYVELTLTCTNEDEDNGDHNVVFNFGSENRYMDHAESGFDELESIFEDAISTHFPSWSYANEWEESCVHGPDMPEDYDGPVDIN